ncbi:MAG: outer-membrane lipoprotein carrier protein LolA [Defluviitaleaceae bacterium]|nr:outer-membrane lipoprotein carrier protein LolA [Defluviitaleaceae bacterium]
MKKLKLVFALSLLVAVAAGCAAISGPAQEDSRSSYERIHEMLVNLQTYRAVATVEYISNRGSNTFDTLKHARRDGRYRIEVTAPENVAGSVTVFDGTTISQFNPRVSGRVAVSARENPERSEIFLTSFISNYLASDDVSVSVGSFGQGNFTVLETVVPGNHPYMASERLWVDNQTLNPVRLVIYDRDGAERVIVNFKEFELDADMDDSLFTMS